MSYPTGPMAFDNSAKPSPRAPNDASPSSRSDTSPDVERDTSPDVERDTSPPGPDDPWADYGPCPYCGAEAGQPCVTSSGNEREEAHADRKLS